MVGDFGAGNPLSPFGSSRVLHRVSPLSRFNRNRPTLSEKPHPTTEDRAVMTQTKVKTEMSRRNIIERMPEDFVLRWYGEHLSISGTCATTHHLEAMAEAILVFRGCLPSTRDAVAGDLGLEVPERSWDEQVAEFLGCATIQPERVMPIMPRQRGGLARARQREETNG